MHFIHLFLVYVSSILHSPPPDWMNEQIQKDLAVFSEKTISIEQMERAFSDKNALFVKVQFINNRFYYFCSPELKKQKIFGHRFSSIKKALTTLTKKYRMPNLTFFLTLGDGWSANSEFPLFVMSKRINNSGPILSPDFFALSDCFQVIAGKDLRSFAIPWENKQDRLIWRGATTQAIYTNENYQNIPRVILCRLSQEHPELINAKFTQLAQGAEQIDGCNKYLGEKIPYEEFFTYKYQLWIDGNAVSYSESGWRFFTNSVIFKPESENVQWYFEGLKPWVHYVPVKANLEDLCEKIKLIQKDELLASTLAQNARNFAIERIPSEKCLEYLYHLLSAYSKLHFTK